MISSNNSALVILFGESFRSGGWMSRTIGLRESREEQFEACISHVEFLDWLKSAYELDTLDVKINTISTAYDNELLTIYKECKNINHLDPIFNAHYPDLTPNSLWVDIRNRLKHDEKTDTYDFIFFCRIDLILKPYFNDVFKVNPKKVLYPFNCSITFCKTPAGYPIIADTMCIIPKSLWPRVRDSNIGLRHETWENFVVGNIFTYAEQGYLIDTLHDSDSNKDWNPLYKMTARKESHVWVSNSYIIDLDTLIVHRTN